MKTDRELLEAAAKAAGIEIVGPVEKFIVQFDDRHRGGLIVVNDQGGHSAWNPLHDDGDALRLAVKLMMSVEISEHEASTYAYAGPVDRKWAMELWSGDILVATRRAIVRAAAAIGDGKESTCSN